jgi:hypothetical protein
MITVVISGVRCMITATPATPPRGGYDGLAAVGMSYFCRIRMIERRPRSAAELQETAKRWTTAGNGTPGPEALIPSVTNRCT